MLQLVYTVVGILLLILILQLLTGMQVVGWNRNMLENADPVNHPMKKQSGFGMLKQPTTELLFLIQTNQPMVLTAILHYHRDFG